MAEGLLQSLGAGSFSAFSAGTVATMVRPEAVEVMQELGIDISHHTSKIIEQFLHRKFDYVVTVCNNALETCPLFPLAQHRLHWNISDPASVRGSSEERLAAFRTARDLLHHRITSEILTVGESGEPFVR